MIVVVVVAPVRQILDLVDDAAGAGAETVLAVVADGLIGEGGGVQHRLDLARERIATGRNGADRGNVLVVGRVVAGDRPVGEDEAVAPDRSERRVEPLEYLGKLDEVL